MRAVTVEAIFPLPYDLPLVKGSAAWLRPRTATLRAAWYPETTNAEGRVFPAREYLRVEVRGHQRDSDRWARGSFYADVVRRRPGWWVPDFPELVLPDAVVTCARSYARNLGLALVSASRERGQSC